MDSHDTFQKQWLKRKKFYKSQNYKIIKTDSYNYNIDTDTWKLDFNPYTNTNTNKSKDNELCKINEPKLNSFIIKKCNGSRNLTEKSITSDSDEDENEDDETILEENKSNVGKCLLKFKK